MLAQVEDWKPRKADTKESLEGDDLADVGFAIIESFFLAGILPFNFLIGDRGSSDRFRCRPWEAVSWAEAVSSTAAAFSFPFPTEVTLGLSNDIATIRVISMTILDCKSGIDATAESASSFKVHNSGSSRSHWVAGIEGWAGA